MFNNQDLDSVYNAIVSNDIAIIPTDTVLGLSCNALNQDACNKIYDLKNRDKSKPFAIFASNTQWIYNNCVVDKYIIDFCNKNLPGNYTIIVNLKTHLKLSHIGINTKIGIRIPKSDFCIGLCDKIYKNHNDKIILCATSVNISGFPPAIKISDVDKNILQNTAYYPQESFLQSQGLSGIPSTIVDFSDSSQNPLIIKR